MLEKKLIDTSKLNLNELKLNSALYYSKSSWQKGKVYSTGVELIIYETGVEMSCENKLVVSVMLLLPQPVPGISWYQWC